MGKKRFRSFTLIEMLIVIVIIGILAAALVPRLQSVQSRARDSKRKVDLRSIFTANEIFFQDAGMYAGATHTGVMGALISFAEFSSATGWVDWIPQLTGTMTSIPRDPLNTCNGSANAICNSWYGASWRCTCQTSFSAYTYAYFAGAATNTYDLLALLENGSDPDRCEVKWYRRWPTGEHCVTYSWAASYPSPADSTSRKRILNVNPLYMQ